MSANFTTGRSDANCKRKWNLHSRLAKEGCQSYLAHILWVVVGIAPETEGEGQNESETEVTSESEGASEQRVKSEG